MTLSHLDESGNANMVDVSQKMTSFRTATATGKVELSENTIVMIEENKIQKGNVFNSARIAGIQAAKRTSELIPLCHNLPISHIQIDLKFGENCILLTSTVSAKNVTGVEMEALTAVSTAALTLYDMCKSVDKSMVIGEIKLVEKRGGNSQFITEFRPKTSIIVLSDSISQGNNTDKSGIFLKDSFEHNDCSITDYSIISDNQDQLLEKINSNLENKDDLILLTGGTGAGPRDITIQSIESLFDKELTGLSQAITAHGLDKTPLAMFSNLKAGLIRKTVVVCLPGSHNGVKDAVSVLIPWIFHLFPIIHGKGH